jgi:hypothetical protein
MFLNEMRAQRLYQVILSDRSIFDFLAYARIRFPTFSSDSAHFKLRAIQRFACEYKYNYDLLLLTSGSYGNPENDMLRSSELVDPSEFDLTLRALISKASLSFVDLPRANTLDTSLRAIEQLLRRQGYQYD